MRWAARSVHPRGCAAAPQRPACRREPAPRPRARRVCLGDAILRVRRRAARDERNLEVSLAAAGQLATVFALAFALAAPFVAALFARVGRRRLIVSALLSLAVLNTLMALAPGFFSLLGLRILAGATAAAVVPTAIAAASALARPEQRGRAIAIVSAGATAAFLVGLPMGSAVGEWFGWRACFAFAALVSGAAALAIRLAAPEIAGEASGLAGLSALRRPGLLAAYALTFSAFAAVFAIAAYIGPAVNRIAGLTGAEVGLVQALVGVASIAGLPIGARLADRVGIRAAIWLTPGILLAQAAQAVLLAGAADGTGLGLPLQAITVFVSAASLFALGPVVSSRLVALAPEARAVALAGNSSAVFLGQAGGAAAGGLGYAWLGPPGFGVAGALLGLLAVLAALRLAQGARSGGAPR
jgi:MFS transporter, DHA1 family, inner membrane transport protein